MNPDQLIRAIRMTEDAMAKPRKAMNEFGYNVPRSVLFDEQEERERRNREHMKRINGRLESWPMTGIKEGNDGGERKAKKTTANDSDHLRP